MKRSFSLVLLMLFAWSLTPSELWHECHEEIEERGELSFHEDHTACAVCFYDFSAYEGGSEVYLIAQNHTFETLISEFKSSNTSNIIYDLDSRGPPCI
jgi:hypothetical protein